MMELTGAFPQDPATVRLGVFLPDHFERLNVAISFIEKINKTIWMEKTSSVFHICRAASPK